MGVRGFRTASPQHIFTHKGFDAKRSVYIGKAAWRTFTQAPHSRLLLGGFTGKEEAAVSLRATLFCRRIRLRPFSGCRCEWHVDPDYSSSGYT